MIRISIIIATFNAENIIRRAIDSIKALDFNDWECIVIDGKSSDGTINIVKEYADNDNRISYISEPDKGIYDAFNKGWQRAKGKWIYYLGADDVLTNDGLGELLKADTNNEDAIYGDSITVYPSGRKIPFKSKKITDITKIMVCCHQSIIMQKSAINELNGFNIKYPLRGDFDLIQRAYLKGKNFKYIEKTIVYFASDGKSGKASIFKDFERYKILKENKSIKFPFLGFSWYFAKKIGRNLLGK